MSTVAITNEVNRLITSVFSPDKTQSADSLSHLVSYLADDFEESSPENKIISDYVRSTIRTTKERLSTKAQRTFQDIIDVGLARIDLKASLRYWFTDETGAHIKPTLLQCVIMDFNRWVEEEALVSIVYSPTGSGKSSVLTGTIAFEIGRDQNIMEQYVCATDGMAQKRGMGFQTTLLSPHYQKIFPHIRPNPGGPWAKHQLLVKRTQSDLNERITKESTGDASTENMTIHCLGVEGAVLGARTNRTNLDDIASEQNSVFNPEEGKRISQLVRSTWFSRKKSPLGVSESDYDRKKNPWRARIIGTPWAQNDPIYSLKDLENACVLLVGVNDSFTAYNVQIWGLPDEYITRLRNKYYLGKIYKADDTIVDTGKDEPAMVEFGEMSKYMADFCRGNQIDLIKEYRLGKGVIEDELNPPKATLELPLSRAREWYVEEYRNAEDKGNDFDRTHRCRVFMEGDLAFPGFKESLFTEYPENGELIIVEKKPIYLDQNNRRDVSGTLVYMVNPPEDSKLKIAFVDLSGATRKGTVITTAVLTPEHRRRVVEIASGGWGGSEITHQIGQVFERHPDLQLCFVESVSMQKLFVDMLTKEEEMRKAYPWWTKIAYFDDTTTKKVDKEVGILNMATPFKHGVFVIPNTVKMQGHGSKCECGYCVSIKDGTTQKRLSPVKSDVLITYWGIHMRMPNWSTPPPPAKPKVVEQFKTPSDLLNLSGKSPASDVIFGKTDSAIAGNSIMKQLLTLGARVTDGRAMGQTRQIVEVEVPEDQKKKGQITKWVKGGR